MQLDMQVSRGGAEGRAKSFISGLITYREDIIMLDRKQQGPQTAWDKVRSRLLPLGLVVIIALVVALAPAGTAQAYGRAVYQIEFSFNCNNPSFCGSTNLGGFWAWAALYSDGTFDGELTGCGHTISGAPAGAQHMSADGHWAIQNGMLVITQETDTFTGQLHGVVEENPNVPMAIGPAKPGHYSTQDILGFPAAPGVSVQLQVVLVPSK
jgi:hypothetical protein